MTQNNKKGLRLIIFGIFIALYTGYQALHVKEYISSYPRSSLLFLIFYLVLLLLLFFTRDKVAKGIANTGKYSPEESKFLVKCLIIFGSLMIAGYTFSRFYILSHAVSSGM